jgi:hypothetical protein
MKRLVLVARDSFNKLIRFSSEAIRCAAWPAIRSGASMPTFSGGRERAGENRPKGPGSRYPLFSRAMHPEVRARLDDLTVFDCAAAEAYYVGDAATMDGRDDRKAVILKVEL